MANNPISARRVALKDCDQGHHAGLLLARYLPTLNDTDNKSKPNILRDAIAALANENLRCFYEKAFKRRRSQYSSKYTAHTPDGCRLIIGLGNASPLEAGITLHHTYGTPIIPGSALKGLCAHYARQTFFDWKEEKNLWIEKDSSPFSEEQYTFIFGSTNEGGKIVFHDAWVTPCSLKEALKLDVITPHHQDYYDNGKEAPTDFDSPVPVPFLSVIGKFEIILSTLPDVDEAWLDTVWEILASALKNAGIGGKTSSGYGRLKLPEKRPTKAERLKAEKEEQERPWREILEKVNDWGKFKEIIIESEQLKDYQHLPAVGQAVRDKAEAIRKKYPDKWKRDRNERDSQLAEWLKPSGVTWPPQPSQK